MTTLSSLSHAIVILFVEGFLLCGFLATFDYAPEADASNRENSYSPHLNGKPSSLPVTYTLYQDVHVMIWIGFGFLMTFLRRYGQSAIGLTFLLGAILVQVAIICEGVVHIGKDNKSYLSLKSLLSADVAVATPLISMGAVLGKTTYMQLVFMGILELIMFTVNKYVGEHLLMVVDAGDSMFVHAFGAYFGLAVSFVLGMKGRPKEHHLEGPSYNSDIFAMIGLHVLKHPVLHRYRESKHLADITREAYLLTEVEEWRTFGSTGTVFLWLFWPSFNSAALEGDDQQRAIINTFLSISASCVIAFATSGLVSKDSKFNMVHVQNSTLAGGVAIGTAAGMMCTPVGALIVGALAGLLSVLGYKYLTVITRFFNSTCSCNMASSSHSRSFLFAFQPLIQKRLRIHDTCGVHNLHGMPGVLAGIFGALMAGIATESSYDYSLYEIFPARAPSTEAMLAEMRDNYGISPGLNRTAGQQAAYQLLVLVITLGIAIVSGLITGLMMRMSICGSIPEEQKFDDEAHWELEEESLEESKTKEGNCSNDQLSMGHI
ncbi:Ammonium transporter Rh type B [Eufriesea mexicana]|uniref:Ammonium transporter Rh type B n=1 Tax=Eufriesea mexicana TaxID=516756 RepID=A0A310SM88_9HYME|nr:Ammonium transporter Rh type B [Eufriesea mexicana]